jgi:hypothetical protein
LKVFVFLVEPFLNPNDLLSVFPNSALAAFLTGFRFLGKRPLAFAMELQEFAHGAFEIPNPIDHGFNITGVVETLADAEDSLSGFCQFL